MQLRLKKNQLTMNPFQLMRQAGYVYVESHATGQGSYMRSFGRTNYPRFHVYVEESGEELVINLHLDQKEPSYGQNHSHNAEYDGDVISGEVARIKSLVN